MRELWSFKRPQRYLSLYIALWCEQVKYDFPTYKVESSKFKHTLLVVICLGLLTLTMFHICLFTSRCCSSPVRQTILLRNYAECYTATQYYYNISPFSTKPFCFVQRCRVTSRVGRDRRGESILLPRGFFLPFKCTITQATAFLSPSLTGRYFKIFVPCSCRSGVHHLDVKGKKFCAALVCCQKCGPIYSSNVHFSSGKVAESNCSYYVGINTNAHFLTLSYGKRLWNICHSSTLRNGMDVPCE